MATDPRLLTMATVQRLAHTLDAHGWDDARLGSYVGLLADLDPAALDRAVDRLLATCERMPAPATIRKEVLAEACGGGLPSAFEAWDDVVRAIQRHGRLAAPDLPGLTMKAIAAVGGWRHVCDSELPELIRRDFVKAYEVFAERATDDALIAPGLAPVLDAAGSWLALPEGYIHNRSRGLELTIGTEP